MSFKTITIIGANGTMGRSIAGVLASLANAKVYMVSRSIDKSKKARDKIISRSENDISKNLIAADYSMLGQCVKESDMVIESVVEDLATKLELMNQIAPFISKHTVCATNTSGFSITTLAEALPVEYRGNFIGTHFFNPPTSLMLCEIIYTKYTNVDVWEHVRSFLTYELNRTTVSVNDAPAFLGNRIGFRFINEALQYADRYADRGGIDYIDSIIGPFTGRSMAPLLTSDFVGLDVHKAITDNLYENTYDYSHDSFIMPEFVKNLINEGNLGRKTLRGFYATIINEDGTKRYQVYDIKSGEYRDKNKYELPFAKKMVDAFAERDYERGFNALKADDSFEGKLCLEFLLKYVIYALSAAKEVATDVHAADDVMAAGYGWCPPFAMIQALGGAEEFFALANERLDKSLLSRVDISSLPYAQRSKYDYKQFVKAKF